MKLQVLSAVANRVKSLTNFADVDEHVLAIQVAAVVFEYVERWFESDLERFETLSVEEELVADVVNPETGRPSTIFDHASKLDVVAMDRFNAEKIVVEHKSTSDDITPGSDYWKRLRIDSQVSKYLLTLRQKGDHSVRSCLYDVVAKPGTRPKEITKADVRRLADSGLYCGWTIPVDTWRAIQAIYEADKGKKGGFQGTVHESDFLVLYGIRLRSMMRSEPEAWFGRQPVTRTDEEVRDYAHELWNLTADVRNARKRQIAPKNTNACRTFNRLCQFFNVCTASEDVEDRSLWHRPESVHVELDGAYPERGRNVITNSRLGVLMTCPRKHQLAYEEGLVPVRSSDAEALRWGSLLHDLLEIVWKAYSKTEVAA